LSCLNPHQPNKPPPTFPTHQPTTRTHPQRANAADILKVQPEGPYLIGGHSYGGSVAVEVALVLESWGHDVGLVVVSAV